MSDHPIVQMAARVGDRFKIDPVVVLRDGGDELINLIRAAALRVVQADDKAAEAAAKKK